MLLTEPLTFSPSGITIPNRVIKAATAECFSNNGIPSDSFIPLYKRWASEAGLTIIGHSMVHPHTTQTATETLCNETFGKILKQLKSEAKNPIILQINSVGNKSGAKAPSRDPSSPWYNLTTKEPSEFTKEDKDLLFERYLECARIACDNLDGVSLHMAHRYQICEMLSVKYCNEDVEQRCMKLFKTLREEYPNKIITCKINLGWNFNPKHALRLASMFEKDLDFVELSSMFWGGDVVTPRNEFRKLLDLEKINHKFVFTGENRDIKIIEKDLEKYVLAVGIARPYCIPYNNIINDLISGKILDRDVILYGEEEKPLEGHLSFATFVWFFNHCNETDRKLSKEATEEVRKIEHILSSSM